MSCLCDVYNILNNTTRSARSVSRIKVAHNTFSDVIKESRNVCADVTIVLEINLTEALDKAWTPVTLRIWCSYSD